MIIEDFIMLGRTVPEPSKKHGLVVCSAGYSKELRSFIRIYPLSMLAKITRWSKCRIPLRRNPNDSRIESWRIKEGTFPTIKGRAIKDEEFDVLKNMASNSIIELNERRMSLGIIAPCNINFRFGGMQPKEEYLLSLFPDEKREQKKPRLLFTDEDSTHDIQLRDWGCYEFLRKNSEDDHYKLWDALKLTDNNYSHLFFVGNHKQHRTSWLVISIVSLKTNRQVQLFGENHANI